MKKIIIGACMVFALLSCNGEGNVNVKTEVISKIVAENEKILVATSIVPLASITNYIGGKKVEVNNIIGVGVSPHNFSMTPQNMINIQKSDIVFLLGIQDIDGFLFKSLSGVKSIALDTGLQVLEATSEHDHDAHSEENEDEEEHKQEGHVHAEASIDPHVWTGKVNSLLIAKRIQEELTSIQPSHEDTFQKNYEKFETEINQIFGDFTTKVATKTQKEFIVLHDAYNYLFFDAGINMEKKVVFRKNVMSEPGSAEMKELIDEVTLHGIKQFFVEPQFESKPLQILAEENNGQILELDPLGKSIEAKGFLGNIKANLEILTNVYE